jgi:hypothetical protein
MGCKGANFILLSQDKHPWCYVVSDTNIASSISYRAARTGMIKVKFTASSSDKYRNVY